MILLAVISLLVGAVLAQRFKVMVLVPATGFMLVAAMGTAFVQAHTAWWTILVAAAGVPVFICKILPFCRPRFADLA